MLKIKIANVCIIFAVFFLWGITEVKIKEERWRRFLTCMLDIVGIFSGQHQGVDVIHFKFRDCVQNNIFHLADQLDVLFFGIFIENMQSGPRQ